MRLRILHETHYYYSVPVRAKAMESRLQPCNDEYQSCQRYRLTVTPKATIHEYTTFNDLTVHYWTLLKAEEVSVVSESVVDTREHSLLPIEVPPVELDPVEMFPYLQPTRLTASSPAITEFADQFASLSHDDWYQTALSLRDAIYQTMDFQVGATEVKTTADEALTIHRGVCQDFTHLMLACLRELRIPARYVSGYLNPSANRLPPLNEGRGVYQSMSQSQDESSMEQEQFSYDMSGDVPVRGTGASHAWCEVYMGPGYGWRGFDPTNNLLIDQHYVRIGAGRDFTDITPIRGVHKGPAEEKLQVTVSIKPIA